MALSCSFPSEKTKELQQLIVLNSLDTNSDKELPSSQNNKNNKGWSSVPTLPTTSPCSIKEEEWTTRSTGTGTRTQLVINSDRHKNDVDEDLNKSEGSYLPDVTEIDSPIRVSSQLHIFSIENPCDLLAQLEQQSSKSSNRGVVLSPTTMAMPRPTVVMGAESSSIVRKDEATADEQDEAGGITTTPTPSPTNICTKTSTCIDATGESLAISFDDNGNPCHFQCHKSNVVPVPDCHLEKTSTSDNKEDDLEDETAESQQDNQKSSSISVSVTKENPQDKPGYYEIKKTQVEEPKYFINAAALSEENFPLSPTLHFSSLDYQQYIETDTVKDGESPSSPENKKCVIVTQEKQNNSCRPPSMSSKISSDTLNSMADRDNVFCRSRVPVSKSFPDIVQTTFSNDLDLDVKCKDPPTMIMNNLTKDSSEPESLVADSLEELAMASLESQTNNQHQPHSFLAKDSSHSRTVPAALELLTESQQGGILSEKPPEAWVIDFNSISLESEMESSDNASHSQARRSNSGSNPNSLAFFVNIDDDEDDDTTLSSKSNKDGRSQESCDKGTGTESIDKKIFSMFVDFRSNTNMSSCGSKDVKREESNCGGGHHHQPHIHQPLSHPKNPIINKTVMHVLDDHGRSGLGSSSARNKFPSPIFQHKAAAESARKAARLELEEKAKAGKIDILTTTEQNILSSLPNVTGDNSTKAMDDSANSNRSSLHVANHIENSFSSSLLSSMENSQPTEMEICQGGPCFKLGKDLLRMFQDGINTDVNISVNGRYVKAHKCILASRSQYFAAILSGHWVEKAGNTINLDGFSYNVVQFTMYHIYSGTNEIPDSIDLLELATLTDLLGLEGLRENISQTIRVKFCHNFHRPCTGCISGVLECFPIALAYGMDELNRKMTKWICKHFVRIWPTKAFANLGDELIEKCLRYSVNHLSGDNILDHTLGCDQLLTTMPTVRWTECIFSVVSQLSEACTQFIGENFCQVLQSQRFLLFGKGQTWNISRIEGTFTEAMLLLKPDEACLSHTALCRLIELGTETIDEVEWSTMFVDFLKLLRQDIERYLMANASKAVLSKYWEQLSQDVRKRICTSSFMGFDKYGNKITKNTSNSTTGLSTIGQSKSTAHRERPSSTSSITRGGGGAANASKGKGKPIPYSSLPPGLSTKDKDSDSSISHSPNVGSHTTLASTNTSNKGKTKVASVRPMQNVYSTSTLPKNTSDMSSLPSTANVNSKLSTGKSSTLSVAAKHSYNSASPRSSLQKQSSIGTVSHLRNTTQPERERSFSNSLRNSNVPSANRTPMKPLTPMTPSKPSPLTTHFPSKNPRSSVRNPGGHTTATTAPPQKTFMNNSARAAAVSKPNLKPASSRTSSSSSSVQHTPRAPNLTQPSRYASNLSTTTTNRCGSAGSGGYSARSSFSSSERPERVATITKAKSVTNNATTAGRHTTKKSTGYSQGHTTIPTLTKNIYGTPKAGVGGSASATKLTSGTSALQSLPSTTNTKTSYLAGGDVFSKDNVMSRSTIETDSGETKIRTLAEIGRSSTFSKDEPTILGKMDGSTYDVGISP